MTWLYILLGYTILCYILTLLVIGYLFKVAPQSLNITGNKKKDKGQLMILSLWFYGAPVTVPITLIIIIKNSIKDYFAG